MADAALLAESLAEALEALVLALLDALALLFEQPASIAPAPTVAATAAPPATNERLETYES